MKYILLLATGMMFIGCSPSTNSNSSDDIGSSGTPNVAPSNSNESTTQESSEPDEASQKDTVDSIVGSWKHGDNIKAIHLVFNADGTFSTRDWDALSGRGEVRTSEGEWTVAGNTVSIIEKTFEGNTDAGGKQQRDMSGTLTRGVLKLNDLEFARED